MDVRHKKSRRARRNLLKSEIPMPILTRPDKPDLFYQIDDYTDPWRDAPYLILQHGNGRSSRFWYSWVPYLSRFYRVVRPDMRGLGQSSRQFNLETEMSIAELVGDLIAIIDALGANSVHICGESSGGIIGLGLAAGHPARVRTLSLVSTPVFLSDKMKQSYAPVFPRRPIRNFSPGTLRSSPKAISKCCCGWCAW